MIFGLGFYSEITVVRFKNDNGITYIFLLFYYKYATVFTFEKTNIFWEMCIWISNLVLKF